MDTILTYKFGPREIVANFLVAEVIQVNEESTTHGSTISEKYNTFMPNELQVDLNTSKVTKLWVKFNNNEVQWTFSGSMAFRTGHEIIVCVLSQLDNSDTRCVSAVMNKTTGEYWQEPTKKVVDTLGFTNTLRNNIIDIPGCLSAILIIPVIYVINVIINKPELFPESPLITILLLITPPFFIFWIYDYKKRFKYNNATWKTLCDDVVKHMKMLAAK